MIDNNSKTQTPMNDNDQETKGQEPIVETASRESNQSTVKAQPKATNGHPNTTNRYRVPKNVDAKAAAPQVPAAPAEVQQSQQSVPLATAAPVRNQEKPERKKVPLLDAMTQQDQRPYRITFIWGWYCISTTKS